MSVLLATVINRLGMYMRDRQQKLAHLALVNMQIVRLVERSVDLIDQVETLKARQQAPAHLNQLVVATLSALISLRNIQETLALEFDPPDGDSISYQHGPFSEKPAAEAAPGNRR